MNATFERAKAGHGELKLAGGLLNLDSDFMWKDRGRPGELYDLYLGPVSRNEVVRSRATARNSASGQFELAWLPIGLSSKSFSHATPLARLMPQPRVMNANDPSVPRLPPPAHGHSGLFRKVLMILAVQAVLIVGLLLHGYREAREQADARNSANPPDTDCALATGPNPESALPVGAATPLNNPTPARQLVDRPSAPSQLPLPTQSPPAVMLAAKSDLAARSTEYVITAGDTLGAVARKEHVSLNALMDANPGLDATKLRIGRKVQIPAATMAMARPIS